MESLSQSQGTDGPEQHLDTIRSIVALYPSEPPPFRFMDLPPEIRNIVYHYILPTCAITLPDTGFTIKRHNFSYAVRKHNYFSYNPPMLRVSQQVKSEFEKFFFNNAQLKISFPFAWRLNDEHDTGKYAKSGSAAFDYELHDEAAELLDLHSASRIVRFRRFKVGCLPQRRELYPPLEICSFVNRVHESNKDRNVVFNILTGPHRGRKLSAEDKENILAQVATLEKEGNLMIRMSWF